jgi:uncharacterized protein involved in response to NO
MKPDHVPIPRYRPGSSTALFSSGFRPFFLLAGVWAAAALGLFVAQLQGVLAPHFYFDAIAWHIHEMLFGFVAATLTGFLLTAIPNWTGHLPLQGSGLMVLVALWIAGRAVMLMPDVITPPATALIDMAFLIAVLVLTLREIVAGRNWRNLPIIAALALFATGNGLIHAEALEMIAGDGVGRRLSLAVIVALITLVGGRVVPSFTRNWLKKQGHANLPASFGRVDGIALASTIIALGLWVAVPDRMVTASFLALAGFANLARLARWYGWRTGSEALVWVLHLGYLWIPTGLLLLGLSHWWPALPPNGALHALTAGAMGTMTLAVMSRATLGHTARDLHAGAALTAAYMLVTLAAGLRIVAAMWGGAGQSLLWIAAGSWIAAFVIFITICGPMLVLKKPAAPSQ